MQIYYTLSDRRCWWGGRLRGKSLSVHAGSAIVILVPQNQKHEVESPLLYPYLTLTPVILSFLFQTN